MKKSLILSPEREREQIQYIQQFLIQSLVSEIPYYYPLQDANNAETQNIEVNKNSNPNKRQDIVDDDTGILYSEHKNTHLKKNSWRRKRNHNACKKVNRFAFNCLESLTNCTNMYVLKKFIHRYDFFLVILLVSNTKGLMGKFSQLYECKLREGIKYRQKFEKDLTSSAVRQFFEKTKKSMGQFIRRDLQKAISVLYDVENLKCRAYLAQAQERIRELYILADEVGINKEYSQKRQKKNVNSHV